MKQLHGDSHQNVIFKKKYLKSGKNAFLQINFKKTLKIVLGKRFMVNELRKTFYLIFCHFNNSQVTFFLCFLVFELTFTYFSDYVLVKIPFPPHSNIELGTQKGKKI